MTKEQKAIIILAKCIDLLEIGYYIQSEKKLPKDMVSREFLIRQILNLK